MSRRRRRGRPKAAPSEVDGFWGDTGERPAPKPIRATPDPAAVLRSLGNPPLTPASAHHLAVVYEEAVRAATALAAANGLLRDDEADDEAEAYDEGEIEADAGDRKAQPAQPPFTERQDPSAAVGT